jgi:hypothetical protein
MQPRVVFAVCGLICLFALLSGCGGGGANGGPQTVPVSGKVVFTKGGSVAALADSSATVEFESVDQPGVKAIGGVLEDGSFNMGTLTEEGGKFGAIAGKHRVRLTLDEDRRGLVAPKFLNFATSGITVTVPSDQPIEIQVWK